jgi:hypothetical protein
LRFLVVTLQVTGAIGLIIVGSSRIRKNDTINNSVVFTIVGFIVALLLVINERTFSLIAGLVGPTFYDFLYPIFHLVLFEMIPNLVLLSTFGILLLFLGMKNKQNFGKFLMFSGIFWIVFGGFSLAVNSITLLQDLHYPVPFTYTSYISLISIASAFTIISSVFFLIYAIKIKVKLLLFSSIVLLVASSLYAVWHFIEFL